MAFKPEKKEEISKFIKINHEIKDSMVCFNNAEKLAKEINFKKNDCIFINLEGNFVFGDFICTFIMENNMEVKEMSIRTLSAPVVWFEMLESLIEKEWVEKINLHLSGYFLRTEKAKHTKSIGILEEIQKRQKGKFIVSSVNTHQKITLLKTKDMNIVFHGSANMKGSQNYEQLMIEDNKQLYDFIYKTCFINK